jgi:WD40 repeat protein
MRVRIILLRVFVFLAGAGLIAALAIFLTGGLPPRTAAVAPTSGGTTPTVSVPPVFVPPENITSLSVPPVPDGGAPISAANVAGIAELGRFGRGSPAAADYSPEGSRLAVATSRGVEILATSDWRTAAFFPLASPVLAVRYSPDGKQLALGQQDGSVLILDPRDGTVKERLLSHARPVHGLAFSNWMQTDESPTYLASGAEDGSVVVWDLGSGTMQYRFENPLLGYWGYGIRSLAFSPDNSILVSGGDQGYLSRWDLSTGKELERLQTQFGLLFHIGFSPDGKILASACGDGTVQLWDYAAEKPLALLKGHAYGAWSAAWSHDGRRLITGAGDGTVKMWDPADGSLIREQSAGFTKIDLLDVAPDDSRIAAVSAGERMLVIDGSSLGAVRAFPEFHGGMRSVAFLPAGKLAAVTGENGLTYLWNLPGGLAVPLGGARPASKADLTAVFSPDGGTLAIVDGLPGLLRLYDTAAFVLRFETRVPGARAVAFSADGKYLAAGGIGRLTVVETGTGNTRELELSARVTGLVFVDLPGGEGRYLAGALEDGSVLIWDLDDPPSPQVLSGSGNPAVWSLAANGAILAAGDDRGDIRIWDLASGTLQRMISGYTGSVFTIALSPDGSLLAAAGVEGSIRLWNPADGGLLRVIPAHNGWVNGLAFSPAGDWLLSAGSDGTAIVWGIPGPSG